MASCLYLLLNWKSPKLACEVKGKSNNSSVATSFAIKTRIAINYCKTRCDDRNFITFDFTTSYSIKTRIAINSLYGSYLIVFYLKPNWNAIQC